MTVYDTAVREAANTLREKGFGVCRILAGQKRPIYKGWTARTLHADDFRPGDNLGILGGWLSDGGKPSHVTVIIDIDNVAVLALAAEHLPPTEMIEGRAGKPGSHRHYLVPIESIPLWAKNKAPQSAAAAFAAGVHSGAFSKSFTLGDKSEALRLIGNGQAVAPPSLHPTGERRAWDGEWGDPAVVEFPVLWKAVCELAAAAGARLPNGFDGCGPVARAPRKAGATPNTNPMGGCVDDEEDDPDFDPPAEWLTLIQKAGDGEPVVVGGVTHTAADRERRGAAWLKAIPADDLSRNGFGGSDRFLRHLRSLSNDFLIHDPDALKRLVEEHYNSRLRALAVSRPGEGFAPWEGDELEHKIDDSLNNPLSASYPPGCKLAGPRPTALRNYKEMAAPSGEPHPDGPGVVHVEPTSRDGILQFRLIRNGKTLTVETGNPMTSGPRKKIARALCIAPAQVIHLSETFARGEADTFPVADLPTDLPPDAAVKLNRAGRAIPDIARDAVALLNGNLRATGELLFTVTAGPDGTNDAKFAAKPDEVFGLIGAAAGGEVHAVDWAKGDQLPTKAEFVAALPGSVEQYGDVYKLPHHPEVKGIYYTNPIDRGNPTTGILDELVSRFNPETPADRVLIKALFVTAVWGGPPGKRPVYLIRGPEDDAEGGRGVGKSTLAEAVGRLVGGYLSVDPSRGTPGLITRLLSPAGRGVRVVFWDNIKTNVLSSGEFEGLTTQIHISGHKLYTGEARRPNLLTFVLTMNDGMLSKDMAQRCATLRLRRPTFATRWQEDVERIIDQHRAALFADAADVIDRADRMRVAPLTRWSEWEQGVLAGCCESPAHFADVERLIIERQAEEDSDGEARRAMVADLREWVRGRPVDPDIAVTELTSDVLIGATTRHAKVTHAESRAQVMKVFNRTVSGSPEIVKRESNGTTAYFWVGDAAPDKDKLRDKGSTLSELRRAASSAAKRQPATLPFASPRPA